MSRIYGGIHWQSENSDGATLGAAVASFTTENFLLPVPEPTGALLISSAGFLMLLRRRSRFV
jgi:hypothetical protein